jgi:murein DD-endopeptidase MepM/ murein hydrolase activator NlpD
VNISLRSLARTGLAAVAAFTVAACGELREGAGRLFDRRTPREQYQDALEQAGLGSRALVRDWLAAADRALTEPARVTSPHVEEGFVAASDVVALGYRLAARRGQEITFEIVIPGDTSTLVFLDVWYIAGDGASAPSQVAHADSGVRVIRHKPRRDGDYVVRAQPELLRSARFATSLRLSATLAFPVRGARERDIGSVFGDARDAGARSHHGIDIFAPRGTPVVAAASGVVTRVGTTGLGGNVVWMSDQEGNRLYYAHLDRSIVESNMKVSVGDTLGFVGNTGNARTTPPHLHFGVYRRGEGPTDPFWFVHEPRGTVPRLVADTSALGDWVRVARAPTALRSGPARTADTSLALTLDTPARVVAAIGDWYRVRLASGALGYLPMRSIEPAGY